MEAEKKENFKIYLVVIILFLCVVFTFIFIYNNYPNKTFGKGDPIMILTKEKQNINTATVAQLKKISGIGDVLAKRIVDYIEVNGGIKSKKDLLEIKGLGESKIALIEKSFYFGAN